MSLQLFDWKYIDYIKYSATTTLKSKYSNMYLGFAWWFIDPLIYMFIFILVYEIIFNRTMPNYTIFILTGWIVWRWISSSITQSTSSISSKIATLEQIAAPKFIFPLVNILVETLLFSAALMIIPIAMFVEGVPFTWHIIEIVPVMMVTFLALFGIGLISAHVGTLLADFRNIVNYGMRLLFYVSPVFYEATLLPENIRSYYTLNPLVTVIEGFRSCLMYGISPDYLGIAYLLLIAVITIPLGLFITARYDKVYAKVK